MQQNKYDPISTTVPHDEDDYTPTKASISHPPRSDLKDEDDLLLYETRATTKAPRRTAGSYKFVRIFTLGLLFAIVATLLVLCTYMCITTECQSRNYRALCEEGFCYELNVDQFQDSDGDGVGDFVGIKNSLKHLRDIGIQTVIIPLASFFSTAKYHDEESFIQLTKEGYKVGISAVIRLDDSPTPAHLELLNKINSSISGFIANKDSPFFSGNTTWTNNVLCYTIVSSSAEVNVPSNNCNGTFYEIRNLLTLNYAVVETLGASKVTSTSVNIVSIAVPNIGFEHRNENFLASLLFMSLTNGAISIKAGDEVGVPLNSNYTNAYNSSDSFQSKAYALMKSIKSYRQYSPKIGRECPIKEVAINVLPDVRAIQKKCEEKGKLETFFAMYNSGDREVTISLSEVLKNTTAIASIKILFQVVPDGKEPVAPIEQLILPSQAMAIVYIKFEPVVAA